MEKEAVYLLVHRHACGRMCRARAVYVRGDMVVIVESYCPRCRDTFYQGYGPMFIARAAASLHGDVKLLAMPAAPPLAFSEGDVLAMHGFGVRDEEEGNG
jgi:hypothetical protein